MQRASHTDRQLGYPDDARLLLINADDFGLCHAINDAIFQGITLIDYRPLQAVWRGSSIVRAFAASNADRSCLV